MSASQALTVAEEREKQAYQQAFSARQIKTAFFYRKDEIEDQIDVTTIKYKDYLENLTKRMVIFFLKTPFPDNNAIGKFMTSEEEIANKQELVSPFVDKISDIIAETADAIEKIRQKGGTVTQEMIRNTVTASIEQEREDELSINDGITSEATHSIFESFFGRDYNALKASGEVYVLPDGLHKWSYNASWLLGHFHKGTDVFSIKSKIDDDSRFRGKSSARTGELGSGFFREIAICYMFGYRFRKGQDNQIIMYHKHVANLKDVQLGDILKYSVEDMHLYYNRAIRQYEKESAYIAKQAGQGQAQEVSQPSSFSSSSIESVDRKMRKEPQGERERKGKEERLSGRGERDRGAESQELEREQRAQREGKIRGEAVGGDLIFGGPRSPKEYATLVVGPEPGAEMGAPPEEDTDAEAGPKKGNGRKRGRSKSK